MMLFETLLAITQNVCNYALSLDPHTQAALAPLNERCIKVRVEKLNKTFYVQITAQKIFLSEHASHTVDLSIHAKPKDLWQLSQQNHAPNQHIEMHGNMHVAQQLGKVMHDFKPDWEEALSQTVGDVAGVAIAQTLQKIHAYTKSVANALLQNSADYLTDEDKMIAAKASIDTFVKKVESTRTRCDRLWVRVHLQKQRIESCEE